MSQLTDGPPSTSTSDIPTVALVGNPNVGKTTVFNKLTNLNSKTSNFSGTTVERRIGRIEIDGRAFRIVDLPGLFSFDTNSPDELVSKSFIDGNQDLVPDAILVVVDGTNLARSLFVARQCIDRGLPTIVAVNMVDLASKQGIEIDFDELSTSLGCKVVPLSARQEVGLEQLKAALSKLLTQPNLNVLSESPCQTCGTCAYAHGHAWAARIANASLRDANNDAQRQAAGEWTDSIDRFITHPMIGLVIFGGVMATVFALVFWLATIPMDWIDNLISAVAGLVSSWLPAGDFSSLLTDGILGGVGGVVVFLPQICILFFALSLLEDSGYLSRAVVVVDRWMAKVGLPGQAFVPLLAAHACAIPAIMSTKTISNRRDRLAAILVIPLMTCSARLPVYTMVAALLFPGNAFYASLIFVGAYALGILMAFVMAFLLRRTILPGDPGLLIIDLPPYRRPSLKDAFYHAYTRGIVFLRDAGTVILLISIAIWFLSTYPKTSDDKFEEIARNAGHDITALDDNETELLRARIEQERSFLGVAGRTVQPVFRPLGFDWQTSVGVLASFAAREVVVSTLSVLYGLGDEADGSSLRKRLADAKRPDGSKVFSPATCISLLVFFVLAMQCLPTQAVTRKETGSWSWAIFQLVYMTALAYGMAFLAFQIVSALGYS